MHTRLGRDAQTLDLVREPDGRLDLAGEKRFTDAFGVSSVPTWARSDP